MEKKILLLWRLTQNHYLYREQQPVEPSAEYNWQLIPKLNCINCSTF
jgi:hypothetical protein